MAQEYQSFPHDKRYGIMEENEKKVAIFRYIEKNPGAHYSKIKRAIGLSSGGLSYHIRELENSGKVISNRNGCLKCFYLGDAEINPNPFTFKQREVMDVIAQKPDISVKKIANVLGRTTQAIEYHIKNLVVLKAVESKKKIGKTHLYKIRNSRPSRRKKTRRS